MTKFIITDGVEHTDDQYPSILRTESGLICGNCNRGWRKEDGTKIRHADRHAVKMCYAVARQVEMDQRADCEAELAVERFFENRGSEEAWAEEQWDLSRGVVQPDYYTV